MRHAGLCFTGFVDHGWIIGGSIGIHPQLNGLLKPKPIHGIDADRELREHHYSLAGQLEGRFCCCSPQ